MMSIKNVTQKRRGRPATGQQPHVSVRMEPELTNAVDNWLRTLSPEELSRSEAIRRILREWLSDKGYL